MESLVSASSLSKKILSCILITDCYWLNRVLLLLYSGLRCSEPQNSVFLSLGSVTVRPSGWRHVHKEQTVTEPGQEVVLCVLCAWNEIIVSPNPPTVAPETQTNVSSLFPGCLGFIAVARLSGCSSLTVWAVSVLLDVHAASQRSAFIWGRHLVLVAGSYIRGTILGANMMLNNDVCSGDWNVNIYTSLWIQVIMSYKTP